MRDTRYWIAAISAEHSRLAMAGGFIQVCHGKRAPLKRMQEGDGLIIYSSREKMGTGATVQMFTAAGRVASGAEYQVQMSSSFLPYRRNVDFLPAKPAAIRPLLDELEFITDKQHWGYPFRFGFFEIGKKDFDLICSKMISR